MEGFTIKEAILYRNGVGWFTAETKANTENTYFPIATKDLDDFLKTALVYTEDGSNFDNISFATIDRSIDLYQADDSFIGTIGFLRGSVCTVEMQDRKVSGRLMGYQTLGDKDKTIMVNILNDKGIQLLPILQIKNIIPENQNLREKLDKYLESVVTDPEAVKQQLVRITIPAEKKDEQKLFVNFLLGVSAWKLTYRLITEEKSGTLEIYAIVDNNTLIDFEDADLTLSTKIPVSFKYDLKTPLQIERQIIEPKTDTGIHVTRKSSANLGLVMESESDMMVKGVQEAPVVAASIEPKRKGARFGSAGRTFVEKAEVDATESVEFKLATAVTIKRNESSVVPLASHSIEIANKYYYSPTNHRHHPFKIVEFTNTAGFSLDEGPISLVQETDTSFIYQGEAFLGRVPKDADAIVLHALEQDIVIKQDITHRTEEQEFEIKGYYYHQQRRHFNIYTFEVANNQDQEIELYLAIAKSFHILASDEYKFQDTHDEYRMIANIKPNSKQTLVYELVSEDEYKKVLTYYSIEALEKFLEQTHLEKDAIKSIKEVWKHKKHIDDVKQAIEIATKQSERLNKRRQQIISSLEVLEEGSSDQDARSNYVKQLLEVDKELETISEKIEELEEKLKEIQKRQFE